MTPFISILAQTPAPVADPAIPWSLLTAFILAMIPVIGGVWIKAKKAGIKEATNNITVQSPFPEVPMRKVYSPPSFSQHMDLVRRVEKVEETTLDLRNDFHKGMDDMRKDSARQYVEILNAGHERETRLLEKMDGIARGIHARINEIAEKKS